MPQNYIKGNHISAGGVICRIANGQMEIVICGKKSDDNNWIWGLPKGTPDEGETLEQTALREVNEETGLAVSLESPEHIGTINYSFYCPDDRMVCNKTVYFYLMNAIGGSFDNHDYEFDLVRWSNRKEYLTALTYPNQVEIVNKAVELIDNKQGPKEVTND